jgi:hypothetical protein
LYFSATIAGRKSDLRKCAEPIFDIAARPFIEVPDWYSRGATHKMRLTS